MIIPIILSTTILSNELLLKKANEFIKTGKVIQKEQYSYLKISDDYIHELYNLLDPDIKAKVQKPNYFSEQDPIGAHITISYPEENIVLDPKDIEQEHTFSIQSLNHAILGSKQYYILIISLESLTNLRKKYGLNEKPKYKGVLIGFHITIAATSLNL